MKPSTRRYRPGDDSGHLGSTGTSQTLCSGRHAYGGAMDRRRVLLGVIPVVAFVVVTVGVQPAVNIFARMKSPHSYSEYEFAGSWVVGLLAAVVAFGIGYVVSRRDPSTD